MKKFFDINFPFNRLQFNITLIVSILLFALIYYLQSIYSLEIHNFIGHESLAFLVLSGSLLLCLLVIPFVLYKRLRNLNKSNKYIFETLFVCNLAFSIGFKNMLDNLFKNIFNVETSFYRLLIFSVIGTSILVYLLVLAVFVKGSKTGDKIYIKHNWNKIFNNNFRANWKDFKGKASRSEFFISGIVLFILLALWYICFPFFFFNIWISLSLIFIFFVLTLSVFIRRLRAVGLKPWHYIILFLPPLNFFLILVLLFYKEDYLSIYNETEEDYEKVEALVRDSFWNVYRPGALEHFLIHKLRDDEVFIPELDFVMKKDNEIIGQNCFAKAEIKAEDGRIIPILTMGPICIDNNLKRKGYGKILLDYSLEKAKALGYGAVCFEGNIDFYGKSGFSCASDFGIRYHGISEGEDASFFLCKELVDGYLKGLRGEYAPPEAYNLTQGEVDEFDKQFPYKEKLKLPGQLFN